MNRAIDPAAAQQRRIGRIDNRINGVIGQIAKIKPNPAIEEEMERE
ncbi:MAG: hypothetical protein BWY57_02210 [Betaproteobacteria bacterium ADurb.Bin341]|nr:MAG: hypothetical protein BWY57_02210 [Betaproteobacteria bacterium ADurb.Bin341]